MEKVSLGKVCNLSTGGTPSRQKKEYFKNGEIKWLVSGDINQREIFDCEGRITQEGMNNSNAKFLPLDSVLIALNGQGKTRGTVALLRTNATCNQSLVAISPKDKTKFDTKFIFYALEGMYREIRKLTGDSGNDRRGLNMRIIKDIKIPLLPLMEQKRIVAKLDSAFDEIDNMINCCQINAAKSNNLLREIIPNILKKYSSKIITSTIGDSFNLSSGKFLPRKKMHANGSINVFGGNGITGKHNTYNLEGENIIIGRVGAKCGNVHYAKENLWLTDNAMFLHSFKFEFDLEFLALILSQLDLGQYSRHSAQPVISFSSIKDVIISFPKDINEQKNIIKEILEAKILTKFLFKTYKLKCKNYQALKSIILSKELQKDFI